MDNILIIVIVIILFLIILIYINKDGCGCDNNENFKSEKEEDQKKWEKIFKNVEAHQKKYGSHRYCSNNPYVNLKPCPEPEKCVEKWNAIGYCEEKQNYQYGGNPCSEDEECNFGYKCRGGVCKYDRKGPEGILCRNENDCKSMYFCKGNNPQNGKIGRCVKPVGECQKPESLKDINNCVWEQQPIN